MKRFAERRPAALCLLVTLALFALTALTRISFSREPVGNIETLPQEAFEPPAGMDMIVSDLQSPEVVFWGMAILLALALLYGTGLWREAGFSRPVSKNLRLLWFPLLVGAFALSGGVFAPRFDALASAFLVVLVAAFGQEFLFRGLLWRVLAPAGPVGATILTSLLAGALIFGRTFTDGPWPEAVRLTALAVCSGFTYGALRWRTASLWPVVFAHVVFALAVDVGALGALAYRILMVLSTLGFVLYGLFLLRNRQIRADGGLAGPKAPRVR